LERPAAQRDDLLRELSRLRRRAEDLREARVEAREVSEARARDDGAAQRAVPVAAARREERCGLLAAGLRARVVALPVPRERLDRAQRAELRSRSARRRRPRDALDDGFEIVALERLIGRAAEPAHRLGALATAIEVLRQHGGVVLAHAL